MNEIIIINIYRSSYTVKDYEIIIVNMDYSYKNDINYQKQISNIMNKITIIIQ
jgi:hypothetical protein